MCNQIKYQYQFAPTQKFLEQNPKIITSINHIILSILSYIIIQINLKPQSEPMVLLHYKKTDHNQFLYQATGDTRIGDLIDALVKINNLRIQLDIFACAIEQLATHGPLKPEEIRGLVEQELVDNALVISSAEKKKWAIPKKPQHDQRFNQDSTHYRTGIIKNDQLTKMLIEYSNKAKKLITYKRVQSKQKLVLPQLISMKQQLKAALKIAYPGYEGLGQWEPALEIAEERYAFQGMNTDQIDYLDPKDSVLWWAGKELQPEKLLNFYTGKNEKTKIIVKLTKSGSGAPMRQAPIDEQTKIKLMSMYHKKQQQLKKIETSNEDDYAHSTWANPDNLKSYLVGGGQGVKWRPKG